MTYYTSSNPGQMMVADEVLAALQKGEGPVAIERLTRDTKQDLRTALAATEFLLENGKITVLITPKDQKEQAGAPH